MRGNPYKAGDKLWWVNMDLEPVLVTVKRSNGEIGCLIQVDRDRTPHYVRYKKLLRTEKMALVDAQVQIQTRSIELRDQLDALFEKRTAIRQRLHSEFTGANPHG